MDIKLSKPMQGVAAGGGVLVVGALAFTMMSSSSSSHPVSTPAPVAPPGFQQHTAVKHHAKGHHSKAKHRAKAAPVPTGPLLPNLPSALRVALHRHGVVVAVVYGAGDSEALSSAREGAHDAHAGFAALNVGNESVAAAVETFAPATADPTVLVVRYPGTVTTVLPGYSDPDTVAQAAAQPVTTTTTAVPAAPAPTTP